MTLSRQAARLDELLNYRLTRLIALSGAPVIRLCEGKYGISRREWRLLAHLAAQEPQSPSALAEQIALDRARTSRAIGSLVEKRLLERVALPGDRRRARVGLSERGQALYAELFPQIAELNRQLLQALDEALLGGLDAALSRLEVQAAQINRSFAAEWRADRW